MILHLIEAGTGPPLALLHGLFGAAQNFGTVQRRLATRFRVLALDLRNHGSSPHDQDMRYETMAADVLETLAAADALPATLVGHSMGGKVAMLAALTHGEAVAALIVADIAPVAYEPRFRTYAQAMQAIPLSAGLRRADADAALSAAVPDSAIRGFLLSNLRLGAVPEWRIALPEIAAALPLIESWEAPAGASYAGPTLFLSGARSDYVCPEHRPLIRSLFPAARFVTLRRAGHWLHADDPGASLP